MNPWQNFWTQKEPLVAQDAVMKHLLCWMHTERAGSEEEAFKETKYYPATSTENELLPHRPQQEHPSFPESLNKTPEIIDFLLFGSDVLEYITDVICFIRTCAHWQFFNMLQDHVMSLLSPSGAHYTNTKDISDVYRGIKTPAEDIKVSSGNPSAISGQIGASLKQDALPPTDCNEDLKGKR